MQGSWAEFGLAKLGYVAARCGWFSDRSVCYLASGRPVVAQDTGFGEWLPAGEGVLAFSDADGVRRPSKRCAPTTRATAARRARSPRRSSARSACSGRLLERLADRAARPAGSVACA